MSRALVVSNLALCAALTACVTEQSGESATEGGAGTGVLTLPAASTSTTGGIDLSDTALLPKLDLPENEDPTVTPTMGGCNKADFLFVIDNSGSMADEQANLIASFPGFLATITQTVAAQDYHIMAVPTDDGKGAGLATKCSKGQCSCKPAPNCCEKTCELFGTNCNGFSCDALPITACDSVQGRGNIYNADGARCELAGDRRYMLDNQPMLAESFECIANIGTHGGGYEKPVLSTLEAISATMTGPGGCNEGFLRDDAILVVIIITDEEDDNAVPGEGSPGDPGEWYEQLVAAKHGDADAVVVLGLVGDGNIPGGTCPADGTPMMQGQGAESAPRLQTFVDMFSNGVVGSVCAPDYTPFFLDAVNVIDFACDVFEPVG